jgi:hypothetical protein
MYKYPNTKVHNHDYVIVFDDESGFVKECPNLISTLNNWDMGAMVTGQRLKEGKVPQNHIDTRVGLWDFIMGVYQGSLPWFLLATGSDGYHKLPWSDGYIIQTRIYETDVWKTWLKAVNESGGIYKHRWGDNEIMSLFFMFYAGIPMCDLGLVRYGYLKQDLFRHIQNIAPGVKDNER